MWPFRCLLWKACHQLQISFQLSQCCNVIKVSFNTYPRLQEGRYLLVHKPREGFMTIFKASDETKAARGVYHLQHAHCGPPAPSPGIPWVPLDPSYVLPFHQKHSRPPCTFPPRSPPQVWPSFHIPNIRATILLVWSTHANIWALMLGILLWI